MHPPVVDLPGLPDLPDHGHGRIVVFEFPARTIAIAIVLTITLAIAIVIVMELKHSVQGNSREILILPNVRPILQSSTIGQPRRAPAPNPAGRAGGSWAGD